LLLAIAHVIDNRHILYKLLIGVGLLGLIASFHGIILAGGRATFEFGRVGYAPSILGKVHQRFKTPANALLINMAIGIIALLTGKTAGIITIACFGAICLYIISMWSFFALRKKEPDLERPFKVPLYPLFPAIAFIIAVVCLIAMIYYNPLTALLFFGLVILSYLYFLIFLDKDKTIKL